MSQNTGTNKLKKLLPERPPKDPDSPAEKFRTHRGAHMDPQTSHESLHLVLEPSWGTKTDNKTTHDSRESTLARASKGKNAAAAATTAAAAAAATEVATTANTLPLDRVGGMRALEPG